jgi:hypothetical protein
MRSVRLGDSARRRTLLFVATTLTSVTGASFAHHGDAGRFEEVTITLTGTVVALQLINPHSTMVVDVQDEAGQTVRWQAEFTGGANLARRYGWTRETLKPGDQITMTGRPLKSGQPYINLSERARILRTATCEEIFRTTSDPDGPPEGPNCD